MTLSLNEVEALAKKATRGAGYSWGMAEEAAKATRWLCAHGIDGCAALVGVLEHTDGTVLSDWTPHVKGEVWEAKGGKLCPLSAGVALSDRCEAVLAGAVRFGPTVAPVLLIPFAASAARHLSLTITMEIGQAVATTDGARLELSGALGITASEVAFRKGGAIDSPRTLKTRAGPDPTTGAALARFAHRTYAPATEASRLKGAGAGLSDND